VEFFHVNSYRSFNGASPSGKATVFDTVMRWFESSRPSHFYWPFLYYLTFYIISPFHNLFKNSSLLILTSMETLPRFNRNPAQSFSEAVQAYNKTDAARGLFIMDSRLRGNDILGCCASL